MTSSVKILISIIVIIQVIVFVAGAIYLQDMQDKQAEKFNNILARKEELILEQKKLESTINELNQTLADEAFKNAQLELQLSEVSSLHEQIAQVVSTPPPALTNIPPPQPTIAPTPTPRLRVTRAS